MIPNTAPNSGFMIDWVSVIILCNNPGNIHGSTITSIDELGQREWKIVKGKLLQGTHATSISVKSVGKSRLRIDGNPTKWLQGHNLFGTPDLSLLVVSVMRLLTEALQLNPTQSDIDSWRSGNYELFRIDCAASFDLNCPANVSAWINAAAIQAVSLHGNPTRRENSVYFGQHSRHWTAKFYSKKQELSLAKKGHALPENILNRDSLLDWSNNLLRAEITLRRRKLKSLGMSLGSAWT